MRAIWTDLPPFQTDAFVVTQRLHFPATAVALPSLARKLNARAQFRSLISIFRRVPTPTGGVEGFSHPSIKGRYVTRLRHLFQTVQIDRVASLFCPQLL